MPPTGFKQAVGSAPFLFFALAAGAWLLLPLAHPVYMYTVVPYLIAGALLAAWLIRKGSPPHPSLRGESLADVKPAGESVPRAVWVISTVLALFVPSPFGYWPAGSILMWGLVGDPSGPGEPFTSVVAGGAFVALYAWIIGKTLGAVLAAFRARQA